MITSSNLNRQRGLAIFVEFLVRCLYRSWLGFPGEESTWNRWLEAGRARLRQDLAETKTHRIRADRWIPRFGERVRQTLEQQLGQRFPPPPVPRGGIRPSQVLPQRIEGSEPSSWAITWDVSTDSQWVQYEGLVCVPSDGPNVYLDVSLRLVIEGAKVRLEYTPPADTDDAECAWAQFLKSLHQTKWLSSDTGHKHK